MKNIFIFITIILIYSSCNKIDNNSQIRNPANGKNVGYEIKETLPLTKPIKAYTEKMIGKIQTKNYIPNYDEGVMVTFDSLEIVAVYTPLTTVQKSSIETYHICYVMDSLYSDFALLLHKESLDDGLVKYYYNTIDDENIGQIVINQDGIIIDIIVNVPNGWYGRFDKCVNWVLNQMNTLDYLACMALGPLCAGTIASMCAVGATEGYFQD